MSIAPLLLAYHAPVPKPKTTRFLGLMPGRTQAIADRTRQTVRQCHTAPGLASHKAPFVPARHHGEAIGPNPHLPEYQAETLPGGIPTAHEHRFLTGRHADPASGSTPAPGTAFGGRFPV